MNKSFSSQPVSAVAAFAAAAAVVATFGVASFIDFLATGHGAAPEATARAEATTGQRMAASQQPVRVAAAR
jgi:hypothetical protein